MNLEELGVSPAIKHAISELNDLDLLLGRIVETRSQFYYVHTGEQIVTTQVSGKIKFDAESKSQMPVVGDWVAFHKQDDGEGIIRHILPRKGVVSRKIVGDVTDQQLVASNVDKVIVMSALDQEFNVSKVERFLTAIFESGATPVVVFNKADVVDDIEAYKQEFKRLSDHVAYYVISAKKGIGIDPLLEEFEPNQTLCIVGSSGVGKSTLVNHLLGDEITAVGLVREGDDKGRHTTTHKEMYQLPNKAILIDTPGIRELQLWGDGEGLDESFDDIVSIAETCRFSDCRHENEPGCAVLAAVDAHELSEKRLENYRKQKKEIEALELKKTIHARRKSQKYLSKMRKQIKNRRTL
jgi:ribosome biogenesis GTPase